ncbi:MAG: DUF1801 domain-containing protein [Sandaracinaceae bacterium]|nr:DUF1801 domain-containing protein [Sandaracinaceae bacterium]
MTEPKTKKTRASVSAFIGAVENETRRDDAKAVDQIFREVTGEKPAIWGPSIIGYGEYPGPTGTWPRVGFSPRKANLVLYVLDDYRGRDALLKKLGKHRTGRACLYINKLADVDREVLRELMTRCWQHTEAKHG